MLQLTPNLNMEKKIPLYVQLYEYIKTEIRSGKIPPLTKLPAKRKLATYLQVSKNTVESAYEQLLAEGYIESVSRTGYFVCEIEQLVRTVKKREVVKEVLYKEQKSRYDFTQTGVDAKVFPFSVYRKISNEVWQLENKELLFLGHPQGEVSLREEIVKYLYESRGVRCSASQIIIGAGTQFLIRMLFQLLEGSHFAVENPGYHRKLVVFEKGRGNVQMLSLDEDGICISDLENSNANVAFVTLENRFQHYKGLIQRGM